MPTKFAKNFSRRGPTPQTSPLPGREAEQVKNFAGGFVFQLDDWNRLDRFCILGSEGNTYYATERKMTIDNAQAILRCLKEDGPRTVARIVEISDAGRAPKNDPALFALALAASDDDVVTRQAALHALPKIARIGTHLFHFAEFVSGQRGYGRALRRAIGNWYNEQPIDRLVSQVAKYQQRDGWSNRDLLRLSHPKTSDPARKATYDWICGRKEVRTYIPAPLRAFDALAADVNPEFAVHAIHMYGLPRECIPTELLNDPDVWAALLTAGTGMPLQAMVRNLGKMTSIGLLKPFSAETNHVVDSLNNVELIRRARLHPFALLLALKIYAQGHGDKGKLSWTPVPQIIDALDRAFYLAFETVEPTNKRILIGVDVSGSMSSPMMNSPLMVCEGAAAMAMTVARTERNYLICAFNNGFTPLNITARSSMKDVLKQTKDINGGGTDCAIPVLYASRHKLDVDAFLIVTDNETWADSIHVCEALRKYRNEKGINAKCIVVGMTSTGFTVADSKDNLMLDVVGFDSSAPQIIADFIRN